MTAYTPVQPAAVGRLDQTLQIIARAGSRKTQVIFQRIAALLAVRPYRQTIQAGRSRPL